MKSLKRVYRILSDGRALSHSETALSRVKKVIRILFVLLFLWLRQEREEQIKFCVGRGVMSLLISWELLRFPRCEVY